MAKRVAERFADRQVVLDDDEFFECTFTRCRVVYRGGEKAYLVGCRFEDGCSFHLEGAAVRTLAFLRAMYHNMGPAGLRLVENTFNEVRRPDPVAGPEPAPLAAAAAARRGGPEAAQGPFADGAAP